MRYLLLSLILINVLYWAWSRYIDSPDTRSSTQIRVSQVPPLELAPQNKGSSVVQQGAESPANVVVNQIGTDGVLDVDQQGAKETILGSELPITVSPNQIASSPSSALPTPANTESESLSDQSRQSAQVTDKPAVVPATSTRALAKVDPIRFPKRCVTVGPFVSLQQAAQAVSLLNDAGQTTSQRVEEAQVWVGHWVHLSEFPTRAAAVAVVERLRKEGIKDIYIEPPGELANTVSLGLFSDLARAETRAGQIRKLDVRPQIRDRHREGLVYWVDVPLRAGIRLDVSAFEVAPNQELRDELIDCDGLQTTTGQIND